MNLQEQLMQDLKTAMKSGDEIKKNTIRALRNAIKNEEIDQRNELSPDQILDVIAKQGKQRRDSIEQFKAAGRMDLVEAEAQELEIIETYLPKQLSDDEIEARAKAAISEMGISDMKGMGPVMGRLTQELKGVADGKRISAIVRRLLSA